mmetsp:Transcript_34977/g.79322  ORF Transcript_34977/g.79322 Transcript_34977/m.79322 type:complete len:249 (-) Transcript_34977:268-1014(-)
MFFCDLDDLDDFALRRPSAPLAVEPTVSCLTRPSICSPMDLPAISAFSPGYSSGGSSSGFSSSASSASSSSSYSSSSPSLFSASAASAALSSAACLSSSLSTLMSVLTNASFLPLALIPRSDRSDLIFFSLSVGTSAMATISGSLASSRSSSGSGPVMRLNSLIAVNCLPNIALRMSKRHAIVALKRATSCHICIKRLQSNLTFLITSRGLKLESPLALAFIADRSPELAAIICCCLAFSALAISFWI